MNAHGHTPAALQLHDALVVMAGNTEVRLEPLRVGAGEWLLLRPAEELPGPDPAVAIAAVLAALEAPLRGRVELFGGDAARLGYRGLSLLRRRLALVPGAGGLLSNRTLRENVALPISVHRALPQAAEGAEVASILERFALQAAADLYPHQVSGRTRHRTCVARATALSPALYVLEGAGEFAGTATPGIAWSRLAEARAGAGAALVVCLARSDAQFERWFTDVGGRVRTYALRTGVAEGRIVR